MRTCRGVLVDSNVLLDVATNDPSWGDWSAHALVEVATACDPNLRLHCAIQFYFAFFLRRREWGARRDCSYCVPFAAFALRSRYPS